jgi:hypothetical protein
MKKLAFILIMLTLVQFTWAQKKEWSSPFVGYSTTKNLTLDKVEFDKSKTLLHVKKRKLALKKNGFHITDPDTPLEDVIDKLS